MSARGVPCGRVFPASDFKGHSAVLSGLPFTTAIPLRCKILHQWWDRAGVNSPFWGTGALRFPPEGNIHARNVTLTVLFRGYNNHHIWQ